MKKLSSWMSLVRFEASGISNGWRNGRNHFSEKKFLPSKTPLKSQIAKEPGILSSEYPAPRISKSLNYSKKGSEEIGVDKKSITEKVKKAAPTTESSGYKMAKIFSIASKKVDQFSAEIREETEREFEVAKRAINKAIKSLDLHRDKNLAECLSSYKVDLEALRAAFVASSKFCTETAIRKLGETKNGQETKTEEAGGFDASTKDALKNFEGEDEFLKNSFRDRKIGIQERFDELIHPLDKMPKDAAETSADIFKKAVECQLEAQGKAIKGFRQILTDASLCFEGKSKKLERVSTSAKSRGSVTSSNNNNIEEREETCAAEAREQVKIVLNMLRQDLISCSVYLPGITMTGRDTKKKQEILSEIQELLTYLREVSRGCAEAVDPFSYARERINDLKKRLSNLRRNIEEKFSHVPNLSEKSSTLVGCCKAAVENAVEKLRGLEKLTKNCTSRSKK